MNTLMESPWLPSKGEENGPSSFFSVLQYLGFTQVGLQSVLPVGKAIPNGTEQYEC